MTPKREKPLRHFIENGISVIPTFENKRTHGSWKDRKNFTRSPAAIKSAWANGVRRFQLHPYYDGFACFDIDRKSGIDGLKEFYDLGINHPGFMKNVELHPAYTKTPSGGYHLYFRQPMAIKYNSGHIRPGLEVKSFNALITAPGSVKDGKTYEFYGDIRKTPLLPTPIFKYLTEYGSLKHSRKLYPEVNQNKNVGTWDKLLLDASGNNRSISDVLDSMSRSIDGRGKQTANSSNRNCHTFALALWAAKAGIAGNDVESYVASRFGGNDFDGREIRLAVESGYKRAGR